MKKLYVCQVVDHASETVISTFNAPTPKYFERQMEAFFKDCNSKKIPVTDFEGFIVASVDVCESYADVEAFLGDNEVYSYIGQNYLDLKNASEIE